MIVLETFDTFQERNSRKDELIFEKDEVRVWDIYSAYDSEKEKWYIQYYKNEEAQDE